MKTVDLSYEQALIMHDNLHIHVIMNIIVTPSSDILPLYLKYLCEIYRQYIGTGCTGSALARQMKF